MWWTQAIKLKITFKTSNLQKPLLTFLALAALVIMSSVCNLYIYLICKLLEIENITSQRDKNKRDTSLWVFYPGVSFLNRPTDGNTMKIQMWGGMAKAGRTVHRSKWGFFPYNESL